METRASPASSSLPGEVSMTHADQDPSEGTPEESTPPRSPIRKLAGTFMGAFARKTPEIGAELSQEVAAEAKNREAQEQYVHGADAQDSKPTAHGSLNRFVGALGSKARKVLQKKEKSGIRKGGDEEEGEEGKGEDESGEAFRPQSPLQRFAGAFNAALRSLSPPKQPTQGPKIV